MKCSKLAIAVAVAAALTAGIASAQQHGGPPAQPSSYEFENYYVQDEERSPSDLVVEEPSAAPQMPSTAPYDVEGSGGSSCTGYSTCDSCCNGCNSGCCRRGICISPLNCCDDEAWQLFDCFNNNNCRGTTINGWIDVGYSKNDQQQASNYNGTVTFNDREEELQGNQLYLYAEQAIDTGGCGWDLGGRVDLLYGTDSRFTQARGLELTQQNGNKWNNEPFYGLAMPQAYLEVGYNDLSVKLGHFYTIVGYESVMATANFFYSHAYTMQYGEPFTHTGALATYKQSDTTNVLFGIDRGWDNWEDDNYDRPNFLGGLTWDGGEGLTFALTGTAGQEPGFNNVDADRYFYSFVMSKTWADRLTYVFQHDYGYQNAAVSATQDAEWYSINQYLFYKLNCCWTAGTRFEWFRDDDGFRVQGIGSRTTGHPLGGTRFIGNFYELTFGLNWSPNANLIVRPELRFDWFEGTTNNANIGPFADGTSNKQAMGAIDLIYTY